MRLAGGFADGPDDVVAVVVLWQAEEHSCLGQRHTLIFKCCPVCVAAALPPEVIETGGSFAAAARREADLRYQA
jgi:hypothetical protein